MLKFLHLAKDSVCSAAMISLGLGITYGILCMYLGDM